jgi:hypothetical protein
MRIPGGVILLAILLIVGGAFGILWGDAQSVENAEHELPVPSSWG